MAKIVETPNLIDLSFDEAEKDAKDTFLERNTTTNPLFVSASEMPIHEHDIELFNNNPFDCIQHLSNQPVDPFDCVEREAYNMASNKAFQGEVKLAKLLSLSDDNILDEAMDIDDSQLQLSTIESQEILEEKIISTSNNDTYHFNSEVSPRRTPENFKDEALESSDSCGSSGNNTDNLNLSIKAKKALEYRKRLLKLSISNSTMNSPIGRHMTSHSIENDTFVYHENNKQSPLSSIFMKAALEGEESLAAESPLKFVDDDLLSDDSPNEKRSYMNSQAFDADLEMLNIPILKELPSPVVVESPPRIKDPIVKTTALDLTALRAKLCEKRQNRTESDQSVTALIQSLKTIIHNIDVIDENKKVEANTLLETLTHTLDSRKKKNNANNDVPQNSEVSHAIKRQGTFDLELENTEEETNKPIPNHSLNNSIHSVQSMPDVMVKSSGTYNGEPTEDRDFVLPKIEPISPPMSNEPQINDIVEQIAMLLEQHQFTHQAHCSNKSDGEQSGNTTQQLNPTFIVVMNTSTQASSAELNESGINESFGFAQPRLRRRSKSLSSHDKIKIVQVSIPGSIQSNANDQQYETPPSADHEISAGVDGDFKTPIRPIRRRNSFSNGTPSNTINIKSTEPSLLHHGSSMGTDNTKRYSNLYRSDIHNEDHQQSEPKLTRPLPLPKLGFNTFKPDLKRKPGQSHGNSVMASTGALKATIPIKKVAPMIKTSSQHNETETSIQSFPMAKISQTSTPMPSSRKSGFSVAADFPNACSTPAPSTSPIAQNKQPLSRPHYSNSSTTPVSGKPDTNMLSVAASGMKRRSLIEMPARTSLKPRSPSLSGRSTYKGQMKTPSSLKTTPSKTSSSNGSNRLTTKAIAVRPSTTGKVGVIPKKNKENKGP